jgi:hypothetical protein
MGCFGPRTRVYALVMRSRSKGRKPPIEVVFSVWAFMVALAVIDVLGVWAVFQMVSGPPWVPWLFGFVLLLLSVICASLVQALKHGDRNMRYYLSFAVVVCGFGFSWPPSWRWLLFLVPIALIGPLWLPRARRFFDDARDESSSNAGGPRGQGTDDET